VLKLYHFQTSILTTQRNAWYSYYHYLRSSALFLLSEALQMKRNVLLW
jgi:hypothetical protein